MFVLIYCGGGGQPPLPCVASDVCSCFQAGGGSGVEVGFLPPVLEHEDMIEFIRTILCLYGIGLAMPWFMLFVRAGLRTRMVLEHEDVFEGMRSTDLCLYGMGLATLANDASHSALKICFCPNCTWPSHVISTQLSGNHHMRI